MEQKAIHINIVNIIGDQFAVEAEEGQKVYNQINKALEAGLYVQLSFLNVELMTTAFLNTAVGQLYSKYSENLIKERITVQDITEAGKVSLKRVTDTAKLYYKDPDALQRSIDELMEEEAEEE